MPPLTWAKYKILNLGWTFPFKSSFFLQNLQRSDVLKGEKMPRVSIWCFHPQRWKHGKMDGRISQMFTTNTHFSLQLQWFHQPFWPRLCPQHRAKPGEPRKWRESSLCVVIPVQTQNLQGWDGPTSQLLVIAVLKISIRTKEFPHTPCGLSLKPSCAERDFDKDYCVQVFASMK